MLLMCTLFIILWAVAVGVGVAKALNRKRAARLELELASEGAASAGGVVSGILDSCEPGVTTASDAGPQATTPSRSTTTCVGGSELDSAATQRVLLPSDTDLQESHAATSPLLIVHNPLRKLHTTRSNVLPVSRQTRSHHAHVEFEQWQTPIRMNSPEADATSTSSSSSVLLEGARPERVDRMCNRRDARAGPGGGGSSWNHGSNIRGVGSESHGHDSGVRIDSRALALPGLAEETLPGPLALAPPALPVNPPYTFNATGTSRKFFGVSVRK
jgi:hypothetical protein